MAEHQQPVLRNAWSASTLISGCNCIDKDSLAYIKQELPDDPKELAKFHEASIVFTWNSNLDLFDFSDFHWIF